ncbi:MAG: 50S ribosomal protein L17 [Parcubacteria group bacterium GW2011_GWD2_43_10]|uniref:Large ribosomal subunit protein bL17 n=5 Tax=Candidatus Vebleniibacteriota TaxID=1817921 RepID=A0A1G2Q7J3_9BACT|nr:MAG: 50S ribosomal protein L17 [Parcubacteria group bacterium GW2011_GWA2_42_80]KKS79303.1 MAG: 50S ribosomal protein L17 [Parcubacteria group bacterium GW2011_GWD1_42_9]KKS83852.1 MAG: 50S ribosomal protein L17 [Parcubacteria group bacterium GW2011_GWD2_43_10]KKS93005.1 MAG: 50S ribosomal protein L17 [Parcubacteria group bacterium GW2011_GWE2_43_12]KKT13308.1 MAG: 50S ribosomal protein L17 [Parcubacteria group bacterium GW2011_GWA1_43_27]KKT15316.1 MAG: 50S ribosomal protein L17 [Parcubact
MRHRKKGAILSRKIGPRRSLLKNLAASLVLYEKIKTTEAKAKAIRSYVERLVTKAKSPTLANRRLLLKFLPTEGPVKKLIEVLGPRYQDRRGGYLRITKLGARVGDRAKVVIIEFV